MTDQDITKGVVAEIQRIDERDIPFCVDCGDCEVGVNTELVYELVIELDNLRRDTEADQ